MRNFEYLVAKTKYGLKVEANQLLLNYLWWILTPVFDVIVFYVVFALIFTNPQENFISFLWIGTVIWAWVSGSVNNACNAILAAKPIISEIYIPKFYFPLTVILTDFTKQLCVVALLVGGLVLLGNEVAISWLQTIPLLVVALVFVGSVATFLSLLVPIFPDLRLIISSALQLVMFCSGIFYDVKSLDGQLVDYFLLNPVAIIIYQAREVLLYNNSLNYNLLFYVGAVAIAFFAVSVLLHTYLDRRYTAFMR